MNEIKRIRLGEAALQKYAQLRDEVRRTFPVAYYPPGVIQYPRSNASTGLAECLREVFKSRKNGCKGSDMLVVGNDGRYFVDGPKFWQEFLSQQSDGGMNISYLLLGEPNKEALPIVKALRGSKPGISFYRLSDKAPLEVSAMASRYQSSHFAFGNEPRFLWVERDHPAGSITAEDCAFFTPETCTDSVDWRIYKRAVDTLRPHMLAL